MSVTATFVQGADAAAVEDNVDVNIKYWYSGSFGPTDEIAAKMDSWYTEGTEVVFACGGGIYLSCQSAAEANEGLMIGVDVDQSNVSDTIITSAMKALSNSVRMALTAVGTNGLGLAGSLCRHLPVPRREGRLRWPAHGEQQAGRLRRGCL